MFKYRIYTYAALMGALLAIGSCKLPALVQPAVKGTVPSFFEKDGTDTSNMASLEWQKLFADKDLQNLVDTALANNQELLITLQEIEMARNEIRSRNGAILPSVALKGGIGVEKVGRYTSQGAGDASTEIKPGKGVPDILPNYMGGIYASWEADIWHKLHNAKKAAVLRYLATTAGKNFVQTNLVAEVVNAYYELLALDNKLGIVRQNIGLQKNALEIVKVQKEAARANELAVQKFNAEVLGSQSLEYEILQQIQETSNRINFLLGRYPQEIRRNNSDFLALAAPVVNAGIPAQLLANRPDIKQAELELSAAKLDIEVARAEFYPSLGISAGLGLQAFSPSSLVKLPESILWSVGADLAAPIINRNAITAEYKNANARQIQASYNYERTVLNAYVEVSTQLSNISNLEKNYELKARQVDALTSSINIANDLFKSARADYFEVLMTQRDALETKLELVETRQRQLNAVVNVYRALGGGWK